MAKNKFHEETPRRPGLDANGHEVVSSIPVAPPVGYKKQPSMVEHIRNMVRSEMVRAHAESEGFGTFEEEDDFDVGDDFDPTSPYEMSFEPEILAPTPPSDGPTASETHPRADGSDPKGSGPSADAPARQAPPEGQTA